MQFQHVRHADEAGDRIDVAQEVEVDILVERSVDRVGGVDEDYRIAIGRRLNDGFGREIIACTRAILDDELLAKPLAEPVAEYPRKNVSRAAGRIADNDVRLPRRVVGRACWTSQHERKASRPKGDP